MITQEHEDATYGVGVDQIQRATGATQATAYRWKKQPATIPEAAKRLIRFAVWGDLAEIFGKEWEGFKIVKGKLYPPFFRGGFTPLEIAAMFFQMQELHQTRRDIKHIEKLLADERERSAKLCAMVVGRPHWFIF